MARYKDITGQVFGDLTAVRYLHSIKGSAVWEWHCVCGQAREYDAHSVIRGSLVSCGCRRARKAEAFYLENGYDETRTQECGKCHKVLFHSAFHRQPRNGKVFPARWCKSCSNVSQNASYRNSAHARATRVLSAAKARALRDGVPFDLKPEDILPFPTVCPILGTDLVVAGASRDAAPSLDRVIPAFGYVKGNVIVISQRANRIKSDATPDELRRLLSWLETVEHEQITPS